MMQHAADTFTAGAVLAGLWAAWLWWKASRIEIHPDEGIPGKQPSPAFAAIHAVSGAMKAWKAAGTLNSRAATWTAVSVVAQVVATVLGRLAMP